MLSNNASQRKKYHNKKQKGFELNIEETRQQNVCKAAKTVPGEKCTALNSHNIRKEMKVKINLIPSQKIGKNEKHIRNKQ